MVWWGLRDLDALMSTQPKADEPGHLLGALLIGVLVVLLAAAWGLGIPRGPEPYGWDPVFMGLFLIALGLMFWASYYVAWKSFFLRWLLRFSMGTPGFKDRRTALFFAFVCLLNGIGVILHGFGLTIL